MFKIHQKRTLSFGGGGGGGGGGSYLDSVISSVCCDLDATIAASYASGQTWANLIVSPADGAGQTDYDFNRGVDNSSSTDDPTFTGTVGDDAAYWSFDNGDLFTLIGANPSLFADMIKTTGGSDFWVAIALMHQNSAGTQALFSTQGTDVTDPHFYAQTNGAELVASIQRGDSGSAVANSTSNLSDDTDYLIIISHSHSSNSTRYWVNTTTSESISSTFNTTTTPSTDPMAIGAHPDLGSTFDNGTRLYNFSAGNEFLNDTKAADIIGHLETRHNRDYTP